MKEIAADVQRMIAHHLASGAFASEDELLREAFAALESRSSEEHLAANEGIRRGLADLAAGRVEDWDDFIGSFRRDNGISPAT